MKQLNMILLLLSLSVAGIASAAQANTDAELEVLSLKMKLSNDGTGIIKNVGCGGCTFKFAKITKNTKAYVNGVRVDLLRVRERVGNTVFIEFVRKTGEVMAIRWSEKQP